MTEAPLFEDPLQPLYEAFEMLSRSLIDDLTCSRKEAGICDQCDLQGVCYYLHGNEPHKLHCAAIQQQKRYRLFPSREEANAEAVRRNRQ